jgi:hypothetical protein
MRSERSSYERTTVDDLRDRASALADSLAYATTKATMAKRTPTTMPISMPVRWMERKVARHTRYSVPIILWRAVMSHSLGVGGWVGGGEGGVGESMSS